MTEPVVSVYRYHDASGRLLYVGVTARGIRRSHEHADTKEWWPYCTGCLIEHFPTRDQALDREEELIRRYAPPYNTVHNDKKDAARNLYEAVRSQGHVPPGEIDRTLGLKERRRAWMALSRAEKQITPCVSCGARIPARGPECEVCKPQRSPVAKSKEGAA